MAKDAYRDAGVDIAAGDEAVDRIRAHTRRTKRPGVMGDIGGFGGLFALGSGWRDPVLVSGTDGVGTKLLVAQRLGAHRTIGIDLVAMCANDVATTGAEPLFFLDYIATGKLEPHVIEEIVAGIADGCVEAGCGLIGGEMAEMPGMYGHGHYDLAGFCVGAVERDAIIDGGRIVAGDVLVGVPSSGLHSNGYSLVRKLVDGLDWSAPHGLDAPLGEVLLRPTRLYVRLIRELKAEVDLRGVVHITGGGILENVPRVLPEGLGARVDRASWEEPPIFALLRRLGDLDDTEMLRTFNAGVGLVAIVPPEDVDAVCRRAGGFVLGEVEAGEGVRVA